MCTERLTALSLSRPFLNRASSAEDLNLKSSVEVAVCLVKSAVGAVVARAHPPAGPFPVGVPPSLAEPVVDSASSNPSTEPDAEPVAESPPVATLLRCSLESRGACFPNPNTSAPTTKEPPGVL